MESPDKINKLTTYLFISGLILNLIFVYFAQERVYRTITFGDLSLGVERHIRSISIVLIFITVLLSLLAARKKYLPKFFIAYLLILGFIITIYLLTGPGISDVTGIMDNKGIGPWVALGLIFVGFDDYRYNLFKKILLISVGVISIYFLYNLIEYGIGLYRGQALARYRVYATNLVWITPFVFLISKYKKKQKYLRIFAMFTGIFAALVTQTRSFLLIYLLAFLFDFFRTDKKIYYTIGGIIVGIIFIYIIFGTESFNRSFELLQQRGVNDTRSNQLSQFISQLNFFDVIVGEGFDATWVFNGQQYRHLDNQWLMLIWWAGLIPAIMYFYLTAVIPLKLFIRKDQDYETKVESFILIIWTLACTGLAIYSTMSIEYYFFVICVIQGRLLYKYSQANEYR